MSSKNRIPEAGKKITEKDVQRFENALGVIEAVEQLLRTDGADTIDAEKNLKNALRKFHGKKFRPRHSEGQISLQV